MLTSQHSRTWIPNAVVLAALSAYTLVAKEPLTTSKAFVSIEIFSQLQGPMAELPNQIFALLHAYVSMQRIEKYLEEGEVEDWASAIKSAEQALEDDDGEEVGFTDAAFRWHFQPTEESSMKAQDSPRTTISSGSSDASPTVEPVDSAASTFLLGHLDIKFPTGRLSLVTGPTGSGKTSLLSALLGEMDRVSGKVHLRKHTKQNPHNVAYAGQFPFLEHATIQENILYHTPYEKSRYEMVLDACALRPDLAILDAGDYTGMSNVLIGCFKIVNNLVFRAQKSEKKVSPYPEVRELALL